MTPSRALGRLAGAIVVSMCAFGTVACFQETGPWEVRPDVIGPVVVGDRLVFGDRVRNELLIADVADGELVALDHRPLPGQPTVLLPLPDGSGILALLSEEERLSLVTFGDAAETRTWILGADFNGLRLSPEANAAMAFFEPGASGTVFANHNEVAYVELDSPADTPPLRRSLASLGGTPQSFHISPLVGSRRYAFIASLNHVAIIDLLQPQAPERSVPLVSLLGGGVRTPNDVRFAVHEATATLWGVVTTTDGNAAYALHVVPTSGASDEAPFDVSLTQLAGVSDGADVALTTLPGGELVALLANPLTGVLTITELTTASSRTLELGTGVRRIQLFQEEGRPQALLYAPGAQAFHVVDIAAIEEKKAKAARTRQAHRPIVDLVPIVGTPLFGALHADNNEAFSIIDTDIDRVTPFLQTGSVERLELSTALGRLFLLTRYDGTPYMVSISLDDLHPESASVDGAAETLFVLEGSGTVGVAALDGTGSLTLWPFGQTIESAGTFIPGLWLDGITTLTEEDGQ